MSIGEILCCVSYPWAADRFCKKHLEISGKREALFLLLSLAGRLLLYGMGRRGILPAVFLLFLKHLLFTGWVLLLFQGSRGKKLFTASFTVSVITLFENFFTSAFSCAALFWVHTVNQIPEPFLPGWTFDLIGTVSMILVIVALHQMAGCLTDIFYGRPEKWYVSLAVPLFAVVAVNDVAVWGAGNGIMVRSGGSMSVYYDQMFSHFGFLLLTALSSFASAAYVFGMNRVWLEQEKSGRYHAQIAVYRMLEEQYRQSERLRHDMKNHVIALSGLLAGGEWEKMSAYLEDMAGGIPEAGADLTGNRAVDALLYQKRQQAKREQIEWECDVQVPKNCGIHEFDLCILFGNILDNALEACGRMSCEERRFIEMEAKKVKKCFLVEGKNSMDRREQYRDGSTGKRSPEGHGIGLLNVKDVVSRYNGAIRIEAEEGVFSISILLPIS